MPEQQHANESENVISTRDRLKSTLDWIHSSRARAIISHFIKKEGVTSFPIVIHAERTADSSILYCYKVDYTVIGWRLG